MTADQFVEQLRAAQPSEEAYAAAGLTPEMTPRFHARYVFKPRPSAAGHSNPLIDLVLRYDGSTVEIGMVNFTDEPFADDRAWYAASFEADPILVDRASGQVNVEDGASPGYVIWECAESGGRFLDALILAAKLVSSGVGNYELDADTPSGQRIRAAAAAECADAAGGGSYLDFYKMLLGVDD